MCYHISSSQTEICGKQLNISVVSALPKDKYSGLFIPQYVYDILLVGGEAKY